MQAFFTGACGYFEDQFAEAINGSVPWIPQKVAEYIAEVGLGAGLDLTYDLTKKYTGAHFEDEMRGLADGCACGVTVQQIRRVHMIGELDEGRVLDVRRVGRRHRRRRHRSSGARARPAARRRADAHRRLRVWGARTEAAGCCASVRRAVH